MSPIITIDTTLYPIYIDAHHSTHGLTILLHNDCLVLLEVQGTFEYNLNNDPSLNEIKLGNIGWDDAVSTYDTKLIIGFESVFTYRAS